MVGLELVVKLYAIEHAMLLVHLPTRGFYENQINGTSCDIGRIEGALAPLWIDEEMMNELYAIRFDDGKMGIHDRPEIVQELNQFFLRHRVLKFLRVSLADAHRSCEAWVHVELYPSLQFVQGEFNARGEIHGIPDEIGPVSAVFTWPNSD